MNIQQTRTSASGGKSSSKKKDMKGISRIDSNGTHGWYVRVYKNGKTYSKLYSDNKYNGKERALKFARKAREMAVETMRSIPDEPVRRFVTSDKRNKSGVLGVSKTKKKLKSGRTVHYYQVTWSPKPGKLKNKQWSTLKYGEDKAFRLAVEFRDRVMREIYGERYEEFARNNNTGKQFPQPVSRNKTDSKEILHERSSKRHTGETGN